MCPPAEEIGSQKSNANSYKIPEKTNSPNIFANLSPYLKGTCGNQEGAFLH